MVTETREPAQLWAGPSKPTYLESAPPPGSSRPGLQGVLSLLKKESRLRRREAGGGVTAAARDGMKETQGPEEVT